MFGVLCSDVSEPSVYYCRWVFFLSNLTCAKVNKAKGTLRNSPQLDDVHVVLEKEGDNKQVPDYVGTKLLMSGRTSRRRHVDTKQ